jgi:hypothetical protein
MRSISDLIYNTQVIFKAEKGDTIEYAIDFNNAFVAIEHLLLISAQINYLKSIRVTVNCFFYGQPDSASIRYASRVDFFKSVGFPIQENFNRNDQRRNLLEITRFDHDTIYGIQDRLNILLNRKIENESVLQLIYYCLNEVMDNCLLHSLSSHGWISSQYFLAQKKLVIMICDTGRGVHASLTENEKYRNLSEMEALKACLTNGVGCGKGQGFGLYATSTFVSKNKGEMTIISGGSGVKVTANGVKSFKSPYWSGFCLYITIKTNNYVNYHEILPHHHKLHYDYEEYMEGLFGN